jgi:hypothetical protein
VVEFHWDSSSGDLIGTKATTATGSGTTSVILPSGAASGSHTIHAVGDQGTERQVNLSFSAASGPTPTATATATATVEPTETIAPTVETPTETATHEQSATATVETPTEAATETPAATAAIEIPTETLAP